MVLHTPVSNGSGRIAKEQDMYFVGIGGTVRERSSSEAALRVCVAELEREGHAVRVFGSGELRALPMYDPTASERTPAARELVEAVRNADGLILSSPGYHGTVSGLVKNAIDYFEDTASDRRPYISGLPVGCIGIGYGFQAAVHTLDALRGMAHALRGWPTPYGSVINARAWNPDDPNSPESAGLRVVAEQVMDFAAHQLEHVGGVRSA